MNARQRKKRRRKNARGPVALGMLIAAIAVSIGALSAVGYVIAVAATSGPLGKPFDKGSTSVVYAADGSRLGYIQSDEIRTPVTWNRIPANLRNATVAIEDERYYHHKGVDYSSIIRAAVKNLKSGKTMQGGSTITQQLVRNIYIKDPERDYKRKIREATLASKLEKRRSKRWILREYLNTAPYGTVNGRSAIGVQAAAQTFFAKNVSDLTLAEAALLAGLPQAPSTYNPFQNPRGSLARRNEVLRKMIELEYITQEQGEAALAKPVKLKHGSRYTRIREPFFFDFVKQQLIDRYGVNVVRRGGLKIYTTIDPNYQEAARESIGEALNQPGDPSSAIVSIDPKTGYIKAMASSGRYSSSQFNLAAQGLRQPGSAFKTMVLVAALRKGISPTRTSYVSKPLVINDPQWGPPFKVKTYDNTYGGSMNVVRATLRSDNSVYMQLGLDVGPKYVKATARLLGITSTLRAYPAEALGGLERGVSPLEMANAYATLASGGIRSRPQAIERVRFHDGTVQNLGKPKRQRVISDGIAYEATKILKQNVQGGTGVRAQIGCPAAGKTGTTDSFRDAWFVGFTPHMATSVWVGYPQGGVEMRSVHGISVAGGTFPAQIWGNYMKRVKGSRCGDFPPPEERFMSRPFFGKYASTGKDYVAPDDLKDDGDDNAEEKSDKKKQKRKSEPRKKTEPPPAPAPEPEPTPAPGGDTDNGGAGTGAAEPDI